MAGNLTGNLWHQTDFACATLDALLVHICVLDEDGTILVVNRAWRAFAAANPPVGSNVNEGANYLTVCDQAEGPFAEQAAPFAAGIRAVLNGEEAEFSLEYPCHSEEEKRWFIGRVTPLPGSTKRVVVAHENITARKLAELAVQEARDQLETQVERRTAKLAAARQELVASLEQLSRLTAELSLSEERQRRRIAEALHDHVVQNLALESIKLDLLVKRGQLPDDAIIRGLQKSIDTCLDDIRNLCIDLSPPILYELGLVAAINALGRRLAEEHGFNFHLEGGIDEDLLREDLKITLFQMARELLINGVKHASATNITVDLYQRDCQICLTVADDGRGFVESGSRAGFGLANIRQKADYLRGAVAIRSAPGSGTEIQVTVPLATACPTDAIKGGKR